jgi:superfamily I DNA and/or RNA helicase
MIRVSPNATIEAPTGPSGWIDVPEGRLIEGHAIEEELLEVNDLLLQLAHYPGTVFIISPFRSIAARCYKRHQDKGKVECGTIHTFQGKEAGIVLLVLGTAATNKRARDWVAATPNMLNVAVTRARHRLYVIGNRAVWSKHAYFDLLAKTLPLKQSGRLF